MNGKTEKVILLVIAFLTLFSLYYGFYWFKSSEIDQNRMSVVSSLKTFAEISGHTELKTKIKESLSDGKITYYEYGDLLDLKEQIDKEDLAR